jgi:thiosulfate dehydrogenase [quinone] large subunit
VKTTLLSGPHWLAVLRIGLGLWWMESFRHKNKAAWFERGSGIGWAQSVADKHRWAFVKVGFNTVVTPRPKLMSYLVVYGELAIGLGLVLGFLTPIALIASLVLNLIYFVLMIHDWAEQGQNAMMFLIALVSLGLHNWQSWGVGHAIGLW